VPVTIGLLRHFKPNNTPLWVDIELDYFSPLYKNPVSSSYLGLLSGFVSAYQKLDTEPKLLTITYGNADGQLPIHSRFLGPWLQTLLTEPQLLEGKPANTWLSKEEALYQHFFIQSDEAITSYGSILQQEPGNADAHYSLGILLAKIGQTDQTFRSLQNASKIDPAYGLGFLDAVSALPDQAKVELSTQLYKDAHDSSYASPLVLRAAALAAQEQSDHARAIILLQQLANSGDDSPLIKAMLGDSQMQSGNLQEAVTAFRAAIASLRSTPQSLQLPTLWLKLASAQEQLHDPQSAIDSYREYLKLFPHDDPQRITQVKEHLQTLKNASSDSSQTKY
jgi:tetratricopeptide (TPR) repeat protein